MLVNKDFLTWLWIGWWLCCQPIRCQGWKSLLTMISGSVIALLCGLMIIACTIHADFSLAVRSANERRHNVMTSLIGWVHVEMYRCSFILLKICHCSLILLEICRCCLILLEICHCSLILYISKYLQTCYIVSKMSSEIYSTYFTTCNTYVHAC